MCCSCVLTSGRTPGKPSVTRGPVAPRTEGGTSPTLEWWRYDSPMPHPAADIALRVRGLRKAYQDVVAVDGLDLEVFRGECFGLLGPNGAGKTTTIEICEGLNIADAGEVIVLGRTWNSD